MASYTPEDSFGDKHLLIELESISGLLDDAHIPILQDKADLTHSNTPTTFTASQQTLEELRLLSDTLSSQLERLRRYQTNTSFSTHDKPLSPTSKLRTCASRATGVADRSIMSTQSLKASAHDVTTNKTSTNHLITTNGTSRSALQQKQSLREKNPYLPAHCRATTQTASPSLTTTALEEVVKEKSFTDQGMALSNTALQATVDSLVERLLPSLKEQLRQELLNTFSTKDKRGKEKPPK
ncbi:hypothetical protein [Marinibactrum halimedae]|uniref:Uncharacterized protein n=1 Tax=Marinibactrum halimedae TaxID=1444977 RepID=A0AA37T3Y0_9GAMM|nr:hypothetical protein [Marinibactrum halimedae]MCD9457949.1 hypothetical protein [Marinibactrum halimedae]GLS26220.1 hypothetical protein GCM10007877_19350 [Marinibactrum halimedae]